MLSSHYSRHKQNIMTETISQPALKLTIKLWSQPNTFSTIHPRSGIKEAQSKVHWPLQGSGQKEYHVILDWSFKPYKGTSHNQHSIPATSLPKQLCWMQTNSAPTSGGNTSRDTANIWGCIYTGAHAVRPAHKVTGTLERLWQSWQHMGAGKQQKCKQFAASPLGRGKPTLYAYSQA